MEKQIKLVFGCDHGGFNLKNSLIEYCTKQNWQHTDLGCYSSDSCDYPTIAKAVCSELKPTPETEDIMLFGILICGSGIGMSITANRIPHIKAALVHNVDTGKLSRQHNNANVLVLAGRTTNIEDAIAIVRVFATTEFSKGRHLRRLNLIN